MGGFQGSRLCSKSQWIYIIINYNGKGHAAEMETLSLRGGVHKVGINEELMLFIQLTEKH